MTDIESYCGEVIWGVCIKWEEMLFRAIYCGRIDHLIFEFIRDATP